MKTDPSSAIFLLGGKDLEMVTIRQILSEAGFEENKNLFDKSLKWGAKLSDYADILTAHPKTTIYGIELEENTTPPHNYQSIDHHNQNADKDASILQVLNLLGKEPNREHLLIAANDTGHIEGMRCFGATPEEIKQIRNEERKILGITDEDEKTAKQDIEGVKKEGNCYVIETTLQSFAPVTDHFYKRPLIVYSKNALMFYGDIEHLKEHFKKETEAGQSFYGQGYFGFDSSYLSDKDIVTLVKEVVILTEKNLFSYHQFMFPFRFDKIVENFRDKKSSLFDRHEFYLNHDFDTRVKIDKDMKESLQKDGWEYQKFEVKNHLDYNELVYFHDFVKDALFNMQDFKEGATSYFFEKALPKDAKYEIKVRGNDEAYILDLTGITLRLFDTGVGILSFEVENRKYGTKEDIFKINDFGRRVYPQFLGEDWNVTKTKDTFLSDYIEVNGIREDFDHQYKEIKLASFILKNLGVHTFADNPSQKNKYFIQPSIDDRMFLLCWYGDNAFSTCVQKNPHTDDWYRYVYVDGQSKSVQNEEMKNTLLDQATYNRWSGYGTFFGLTRYSFVCLTSSLASLQKNNALFLIDHMKTMYYQMITLLLSQRASLLRFSDEITAISDISKDKPTAEKIAVLYKNYLRFVNKLYFKEITPQDQGIELYEKAIDILNVKRDVEDLRNEIMTLNSYAYLEQEREEKEEMNKLTRLGTLLLPATLVAGIFGMNIFGKDSIEVSNWSGFAIAGLSMIVLTWIFFKVFGTQKKKGKK